VSEISGFETTPPRKHQSGASISIATNPPWYWKSRKREYRTRVQQAIEGRLAFDLLWEYHAEGRSLTTKTRNKLRAA
jgi:hypothetical protein